MDFGGINYLAVLSATVAAFAFGAMYYSLLSKLWIKAARTDPDEMKMSPMPFSAAFAGELIMPG